MEFPLTIGIGVANERWEKMMKNRHSFKRAVMILSTAAIFMGTGVFGTAVTAWADPGDATVNSEGINVRASAVDGETTDTLSAGKEVTVLDSTTGSDGEKWYQIEYTSSGQTFSGWVRGDLLDVEDTETETEEAEAEAQQAAEEAEQAAEEAQAAERETAEEEKEEETQPAEIDTAAINLVVSDSIPVDIIPDGFEQTTVNYEGREVAALEMEDADVYLLYMEDTSHQTDGRLVVYDMAKSELIPYINFPTDDGYIILLNIPDAELSSVSDRFAKTVCEFETGTMDALQMTQKDSVISDSADLADFYYMYGVNQDGSYGWYTYNAPEGTIEESILSMHYNLNGTSVDEEEESTSFSLDSLSMVVIVGIIVIFLLLLILVIIFGVRYRQLAKAMDGKNDRDSVGVEEQTPPASNAQDDSAYGDIYGDREDSPDSATEPVFTEQEGSPIPQSEEAPIPHPEETPTPQPEEAPLTPEPEEAPPTPEPEKAPTPRPEETPTPKPEEAPAKKPDDAVKGTPDPEDDDLEFL